MEKLIVIVNGKMVKLINTSIGEKPDTQITMANFTKLKRERLLFGKWDLEDESVPVSC